MQKAIAGANLLRSARAVFVPPRTKLDFWRKLALFAGYESVTRQDVLTRQKTRFYHLLHHAYRHSSFYRESFHSQGIYPENFQELHVTDLPIITKETVMTHFDRMLCAPDLRLAGVEAYLDGHWPTDHPYLGKYMLIHSSGTSGRVGIFAYDERELNIINILFLRYIYGVNNALEMARQRIAFAGMTNGHYAAYSIARRARSYGLPFLPLSLQMREQDLLSELQAFQPTILMAYPSLLESIIAAQLSGRLHLAPELIISGAEPLSSRLRRRCKQAFGSCPRDIYGASESILIGAETSHQEGMYLFDDWTMVETQKESGVAGREGVLITNLYNHTLPLIRYRLDDLLDIDWDLANASLPLPRIRRVLGRTEDALEFKLAGKSVSLHPMLFVEFYVRGMRELQVVRDSAKALTLRVVLGGKAADVLPRIHRRMNEILGEAGLLGHVEYRIQVVDDFMEEKTGGKRRLIVEAVVD